MSMIAINNFEMYYKKEGNGKPIILLHGNGESSKIFDKTIKKLSRYYLIYALDTRCHGKSTGNLTDLHYDTFVEDLKAFMDDRKIKSAMIYGYSDGGITAIKFALKYPKYVEKLMLSGVNIFPKGLKFTTRVAIWFKAKFSKSIQVKAFNQLMLNEPHLTFEELKKLQMPVLMTVGKHDCVKIKHSLKIHQSLAHSEMVMVNKANHYNYVCNSSAIGKILFNYLTNQPQN